MYQMNPAVVIFIVCGAAIGHIFGYTDIGIAISSGLIVLKSIRD